MARVGIEMARSRQTLTNMIETTRDRQAPGRFLLQGIGLFEYLPFTRYTAPLRNQDYGLDSVATVPP